MNNSPGYWPDSIVPVKEADRIKWGKEIIDYAIDRWVRNRSGKVSFFQDMANSYNGILSENMSNRMNKMFGNNNRMPFVDFRISRNKVDTLLGEFLMRSIRSIPFITNKEVHNAKADRLNQMLGMWVLRDYIEQAKEGGMDITGGVPVPKTKEEAIALASYKTKAEIFFTRVSEHYFKTTTLKEAYHECLRDLCLTSEAHFRVFTGIYGEPKFEQVSPEDAIFEEMKNDPFVQKSPYKGARLWMTKNQIYKSFDLTPDERKTIQGWMDDSSLSGNYIRRPGTQNGEAEIAVFHIEWKGLEAWVGKEGINPKTGRPYYAIYSHEFYYNNQKDIEGDVKKGKYKIDPRYKEYRYEGYRIGDSIYKNIRKAPNATASINDPYEASYTYINLLFNTVGGVRVPFYALMEEVKFQYNMVRNMINRELGKFKGVVFGYNRALLPTSTDGKPVSMNYILWRMVNDGIIDYNSAAEGNISGRDIEITDFFKATDLGMSNSMEMLIRLALDLERLLDRISAINDNRQGLTTASETATNAQNNIISSRTITEPMMFFFDRFIEKTVKTLLDTFKVFTLIDPERAANVIGEDGVSFFEGFEPADYDLGVYIENTRYMESVRNRIQKYVETSINAGQLPIPQAFEAELAETVSEAKLALQMGWNKIQEINAQQQQAEAEQAQQQQQQDIDREIEAREDGQRHEMEKISAKAQAKAIADAQKAANQSLLQRNKS